MTDPSLKDVLKVARERSLTDPAWASLVLADEDHKWNRRLFWTGFASLLLGCIVIFITIWQITQASQALNATLEASHCESMLDTQLTMKGRLADIFTNPEFPQSGSDVRNTLNTKKDHPKAWYLFQAYWHHSFDEWHWTKRFYASQTAKLDLSYSRMWEEYYGPLIANSLRYDEALRTCAYVLTLEDRLRSSHWPAKLKAAFALDILVAYRSEFPNDAVPEFLYKAAGITPPAGVIVKTAQDYRDARNAKIKKVAN